MKRTIDGGPPSRRSAGPCRLKENYANEEREVQFDFPPDAKVKNKISAAKSWRKKQLKALTATIWSLHSG